MNTKRLLVLLLSVVLCMAAMTGCQAPDDRSIEPETPQGSSAANEEEQSPEPDGDPLVAGAAGRADNAVYDSLLTSYYAAQGEPAYKLVQSGRIGGMVEHWTAADIGDDFANPQWSYDTFAEYRILDHDLNSVATDELLYYCTFRAEDGRCGYTVLRYEKDEDGGGLGNLGTVATAHPYDLAEYIDDIVEQLGGTDLDPASASAVRVKLVDTGNNHADEGILITDDDGNRYFYYLDTLEIETL